MPAKAPKTPEEEELLWKNIEPFAHYMGRMDRESTKDMIQAMRSDQKGQYTLWDIPKKNGSKRTIEQPSDELKSLQRQMNSVLKRASVSNSAFAFHPGRSAYRGLRRMGDQLLKNEGNVPVAAMFETDIRDFFPSVTSDRVQEEVRHFLFRTLHRKPRKGSRYRSPQLPMKTVEQMAEYTALLCTVDGHLPQGAPTSPILANMVASSFDVRIQDLLGSHLAYGRYADDIVVLGTSPVSQEIRTQILNILKQHSFEPVYEKTAYREEESMYRVWGVDLLPPSNTNPRGLRFRVPMKKLRELTTQLYTLIDTSDLPSDPIAFQSDPRVQSTIGMTSHVYNVSRYGNDISLESDHMLPPRVAKAWSAFLAKYGDRLTSNQQKSFSQYDIAIHSKKERVPIANSSELQERITDFCTIEWNEPEKSFREGMIGGTEEEFRKSIDEEKRLLQRDFFLERDGSNYSVQRGHIHTALQTEIRTLTSKLENLLEIDEEVCAQSVRILIQKLIAFMEMLVDKQFSIPDSERTDTSLLPQSVATAWHELRTQLGARARKCKQLDRPWNAEKITVEERTPRFTKTLAEEMGGSYLRRPIAKNKTFYTPYVPPNREMYTTPAYTPPPRYSEEPRSFPVTPPSQPLPPVQPPPPQIQQNPKKPTPWWKKLW